MTELDKNDGRRSWRRRRRRTDGSLAPFGAVYVVLLGLGTVGALAVYLLLIAFVPGASGTRLDAMKTALLVVAGSGAGAGLYVQYRKQQTDEAKSALDHANSRRDQDKLFTERYTAAVAQLGNPAAAVRLGGVYALARIADDSERDRSTCLKVLCAYLRMPYGPDGPAADPAEREVRTTAQTGLAERLRSSHPGFWPDAQIDLTAAHLVEPDFRDIVVQEFKANRAAFGGDTRFDGATIAGDAWFAEASFDGDVWFDGATFRREATLDRATFRGDAWFNGATFGKIVFDQVTFERGALFNEATFRGFAQFDGAMFTKGARFGRATFNAGTGFDGVDFRGDAWFYEATFCGKTSFSNAGFYAGAAFNGTTFIHGVGFGGAKFGETAEFGGATFGYGPAFGAATFEMGARFDGATFTREYPPVWPAGLVEPAGIVWDPPNSALGPAALWT